MYRAEVVGTRAALALGEAGLPRPYIIGTVHSSRVRSDEDRELVCALTPHMDRLIAVSRAIVRKLENEGRTGAPVELIYNGVDLSRYDHQEACCTLPEEYGFETGTPLVGVVARLEPEKGHPTLLEAWPSVIARVPAARLLVIGEGSRREALEAQAEALGLLGQPCEGDTCVGTRHARPHATVVFTGRRDDVPAVTAALDVAVLPSYREALGPGRAGGDGAQPAGRGDQRRRHPGDGRARADRAAGRRRTTSDALADAIVRMLARPSARRHARPRWPRPRPRALLHRAHGRGHADALRRRRRRCRGALRGGRRDRLRAALRLGEVSARASPMAGRSTRR